MAKYKRVYEPWQIKNVKFKNRMLKTPQDMNMADFKDGSITQELVAFYEALARGGIGGIITSSAWSMRLRAAATAASTCTTTRCCRV